MSIYRDKRTGRWRFDFDARINGQRVRRRQLLPPGWTRAQADAFDRKESSALHAIAAGIARPRRTIDQAVAGYLTGRAPDLKDGPGIKREIEATRDWWTGRPVEQLPEVCSEYAEDQAGALQPATIKNRIAYLRAAVRWDWKRNGASDADPGARVVSPTVRNSRDVFITRAQMIRLARACEDRGTRALIRVAFYSGMRVSEQYAAERLPGLFVLRDTKNGTPRVVPIHSKAASAARVPLTPRSQIDWWWRKARTAVGLEHVTLHDLRHSAASAMVNAGIDLATVGAVLGHKSTASTKRYSHWGTARLSEAVAAIGGKKLPHAAKKKAAG
jgi:integrase